MSTEEVRVELGELIHENITDRLPVDPSRLEVGAQVDVAIDAVLAAGYRKPRTITTAEELSALPKRTVIRDLDGDVLVADPLTDGEMFFRQIDETYPLTAGAVVLPATVLYQPEASK